MTLYYRSGGEIMNNLLSTINYCPAIRTSRFELAALTELDKKVKQQVAPLLILRSNSESLKDIERFLSDWDGGPLFVDNSRYTLDQVSGIAPLLDNSENHYEYKYNFFENLSQLNSNIKPVVGFNALDDARSVTQFALKVLDKFGYLGIRLEIDHIDSTNLDKKLGIFSSIMNAIPDEKINKILLIIDICSIEVIPSLSAESAVMKCVNRAISYEIKNILTLSTSWPNNRPNKDEELEIRNIDPIWQAYFAQLVNKSNPAIRCIYGDYASTNPLRDISDDYDPAKMSLPIPFAGYAFDLGWIQYRYGKSGEWEQLIEVAKRIVETVHFKEHGENFCWGNRRIHAISRCTEEPKTNSVWNKIRINQHITLLNKLLTEDLYNKLLTPKDEDE